MKPLFNIGALALFACSFVAAVLTSNPLLGAVAGASLIVAFGRWMNS